MRQRACVLSARAPARRPQKSAFSRRPGNGHAACCGGLHRSFAARGDGASRMSNQKGGKVRAFLWASKDAERGETFESSQGLDDKRFPLLAVFVCAIAGCAARTRRPSEGRMQDALGSASQPAGEPVANHERRRLPGPVALDTDYPELTGTNIDFGGSLWAFGTPLGGGGRHADLGESSTGSTRRGSSARCTWTPGPTGCLRAHRT
jgi:hypothetical protein